MHTHSRRMQAISMLSSSVLLRVESKNCILYITHEKICWQNKFHVMHLLNTNDADANRWSSLHCIASDLLVHDRKMPKLKSHLYQLFARLWASNVERKLRKRTKKATTSKYTWNIYISSADVAIYLWPVSIWALYLHYDYTLDSLSHSYCAIQIFKFIDSESVYRSHMHFTHIKRETNTFIKVNLMP